MKSKFLKILSTGTCCIMISVLVSAYLPQNNKIALSDIPTHQTTIIKYIDPPFL